MNAVDYATGLLLVGIVACGFWVTAGSARGRLLPDWTGAPAVLARIVLALSVAVVTSEALGLFGALSTAGLIVAALTPALGLRLRRRATVHPTTVPPPPIDRLSLALAVAASVLTAIRWAGPALESLDVGIYREDSVWYHLPFSAWFAQTGSIGGLLPTDPLKLAVWYYPLNSELLAAGGMVLLGNDLLSSLLNFGWMGLALLAAWCVGRPYGLAAVTALGGAVVVGSEMMLTQAGDAASDIAGLACLLAAVALLANGWARDRDRNPGSGAGVPIDSGTLTVAALAAGLAVGTKVTLLVPVGVITIGVLLVQRGGLRRRAAIWLAGLFATGGFWYVRNLVHAGNPLPWIHLGPLSGPAQLNLYPRPEHAVAEYLADHRVWSDYFIPGLEEALGPLWFVALFAVLAGIVLGLRCKARLIRLLAAAAAATLVAYVLTPTSASGALDAPYGFALNLRYAAPGIALALVMLPLTQTRRTARLVLGPAYALLVATMATASSGSIGPRPATAIALGAGTALLAL